MIRSLSLSSALVLVAAALMSFAVAATKTVKIQTTAVCGMCKDRIESVMGQLDGVEDVRLDLTTKKVRIKYDDAKQSEASLRMVISKIGYGADDVEADAAAFEALPGCCKSAEACSASKKMKAHAGPAKASAAPAKSCMSAGVAAKACSGPKACAKGKATSSAAAATATATQAIEGSDATVAAKPCCAAAAKAGKACCSSK